MTINYHPSDEALLRCAAGTLPVGPLVVVRAHCDMCSTCARRLEGFEAVGGAVLEELPASPMASDALNRILATTEPTAGHTRVNSGSQRSANLMPNGKPYPRSLNNHRIGRFHWIAPGFRRSRVTAAVDRNANIMLMRIGAGRMMPEHGHTGTEYTLVLSGSFSDASGHYKPGDLIELDTSVEHQPVVDPDGECMCLAALEGEMRLKGIFGRLAQMFVRL